MKTYKPEEISLIIDGHIVSGFAEGSIITVERDEDSFTFVPSTTGGGSRSKNANKAGKITFRLQQTSESNQVMSTLVKNDEDTGEGVVSALVRDNSGNDKHGADEGYITRPAKAEYAKEISNPEWIYQAEELEMNLGGN